MAYDSTTAELLSENRRLKGEIELLAPDAERYRTMLANLETMVLRTEKGSTLTLKAAKRGEEFTRRGADATLDGLGAA